VAEDAEVLDFFVGARVLAAELVAGEGEDFEVFVGGFEVCEVDVLVLMYLLDSGGTLRTLVESLKIIELRSETALAGGVDGEDDLALHVGEREGRSLVIFGLEVVESGSGRHGACFGCGCGGEEGSGFGRGQVMEKRGSQSSLAEAWCYEHGNRRMAAGVV
jgi:hypothetical protein